MCHSNCTGKRSYHETWAGVENLPWSPWFTIKTTRCSWFIWWNHRLIIYESIRVLRCPFQTTEPSPLSASRLATLQRPKLARLNAKFLKRWSSVTKETPHDTSFFLMSGRSSSHLWDVFLTFLNQFWRASLAWEACRGQAGYWPCCGPPPGNQLESPQHGNPRMGTGYQFSSLKQSHAAMEFGDREMGSHGVWKMTWPFGRRRYFHPRHVGQSPSDFSW